MPGNLSDIAAKRRPDYLMRKIKALEKAVQSLATARSLSAAEIGSGSSGPSSGGSLNIATGGSIKVIGGDISVTDGKISIAGGVLQVVDTNGNIVATIGSDEHGTGLRAYRSDGSVLFASMGADVLGFNHTTILDRVGRIIVQDDVLHGGIGRPMLSIGALVNATPPSVDQSTTSADYVTIQTGFCLRWNPQVRLDAIVSSSDAATTGNVQLVDASANVIGVIPVPPGAVSYVTLGPLLWPVGTWTAGDGMYLSVQAQRTAGAGTIGVKTTGLWGWAT